MALFAALSASYIFVHEPWCDEAQAWLIARDAPTFSGMIRLMGYEGTPALWHVLIRPVARTGLPMTAMAVLHALIAVTAAAILLRGAPFGNTLKCLILSGYYFAFEYNAVARSYALSLVLVLLVAATDASRRERPFRRALLLGLLAHTSTHGLVLSLAFAFEDVREIARASFVAVRRDCVAAGLFAVFLVVAIWQLRPPEDLLPRLSAWDASLTLSHIGKIPNAVVGAFLPVPTPGPHFWNSKILYDVFHPALRALGVPLFLLSLAVLRDRPRRIYLVASLGLFAVFFFKHSGQNRHHGFLFLAFFACLWIQGGTAARFKPLVTGMFVAQAVAAAIAVVLEFLLPFSAAPAAATYIARNESAALNAGAIAAYPAARALSLLAHLPAGSKFYYLDRGTRGGYGSYEVWNRALEEKPLATCQIAERLAFFAASRGVAEARVILNRDIAPGEVCAGNFRRIAAFPGAVVPDENFYVFLWREGQG